MRRVLHTLLITQAMFALVVLAGCGGDGQSDAQAPKAAIEGNASDAAAGSADAAPNSTDSDSGPAGAAQGDPKHPVVEFQTNLGTFRLKLDAEEAPLTVDNFLGYVARGHYDGTIFDQVFAGQGVIGGLYTPELEAKETQVPIRNEADNGLKNTRGSIAMVRAADAIDSATAHFFINVADNPSLDHSDRTAAGFGYCVFGEVVEGMDVVDEISRQEVRDSADFQALPVETVLIESARRLR